MPDVTIQISDSDFNEIVRLLEQRVRSERGRIAAFRGRHDRSNEYIAENARDRYLELRNNFVEGLQIPEINDA